MIRVPGGLAIRMKTLNSPPKFLIYAVIRAIRHPRTPVSYYYCLSCKIRFPTSATECPKCGNKVGESPENRKESPIPWWGAILCILIGIGAWVTSACLQIGGLDEAARALVYIPLGSLFGMSLKRD
ncbi:hypothetical protein ES703_69347 [subsurface metagenome]